MHFAIVTQRSRDAVIALSGRFALEARPGEREVGTNHVPLAIATAAATLPARPVALFVRALGKVTEAVVAVHVGARTLDLRALRVRHAVSGADWGIVLLSLRVGGVAVAGRPGFWSWVRIDEITAASVFFRQITAQEAAADGDLSVAAPV